MVKSKGMSRARQDVSKREGFPSGLARGVQVQPVLNLKSEAADTGPMRHGNVICLVDTCRYVHFYGYSGIMATTNVAVLGPNWGENCRFGALPYQRTRMSQLAPYTVYYYRIRL
jgi:hypothetical protein